LRHHGLSIRAPADNTAPDSRIVPYCYGFIAIDDISGAIHGAPRRLLHAFTAKSANAILLEYIPSATPLSTDNVTPEICRAALQQLERIHAAGVLHGDPLPRNLLVLEDGRVRWIDFDCAKTSAFWELEDCHFAAERRRVERLLWEDLVSISPFFNNPVLDR
jgi:serine/threonine protein kinase